MNPAWESLSLAFMHFSMSSLRRPRSLPIAQYRIPRIRRFPLGLPYNAQLRLETGGSSLRPELPVAELVLQARVPVEYHQRALALQVSHHARHAVFRRYGHQHVHVVGHQVPLYYLDALVLAELPEYLPYVLPDLVVDDFAPILRREHDVVLAHPLRVRQAVRFLRHGLHTLSSRVLDGLNNRQYRAGGWLCKADCRPPA